MHSDRREPAAPKPEACSDRRKAVQRDQRSQPSRFTAPALPVTGYVARPGEYRPRAGHNQPKSRPLPGPDHAGSRSKLWQPAKNWQLASSRERPKPSNSPNSSPPVALFFFRLAPYIRGAGSPAMEINGRRNKPFGPGGSTRRLHPSPSNGGFRRGRNRIDEGVKGEFFLGMVPPLSGYAIVANDNYAPVAQAA